MEFRGHRGSSIDSKWRLKIPQEFREYLIPLYGENFFITTTDKENLLVFPIKVWIEVENEAKKNPSLAEIMPYLNALGRSSKIDSQGKVLIPEYMRKKNPSLQGNVMVVAVIDHLVVYTMDAFSKLLDEKTLSHERFQRIRVGGSF